MDDLTVGSLIVFSDQVDEFLWDSIVPHQFSQGASVQTVESLFKINEIDIERRIPFQGLFYNDPEGGDLIRA